MKLKLSHFSFKRYLPFLSWVKILTPTIVKDDMLAGVTVALINVPQAIAYSQLAGLPPQVGLYASLLPPIIASLFGSSRYLSTGPVAIVSLLTATTLSSITVNEQSELLVYAIMLALLVGLFQLFLGLLKFGVIVNFISHPVIIGFTNAAAIIIATSQLPKVFGITLEDYERHYETLYHLLLSLPQNIHWLSVLIALYAFVAIVIMRKINPRIPGVLLVVAITTYFSFVAGFRQEIRIPLTAIKSPELLYLVKKYELNVSAYESKLKEKIKLQKEIEELQSSNSRSSLEYIEIISLLQKNTFELTELEEQGRLYRSSLQSRSIYSVKQNNGSSEVVIGEDIKESERKNARLWRIKISENLHEHDEIQLVSGGSVVGVLPKGLPPFSFPLHAVTAIPKLLNGALIIALLGFMESISIAKSLANKTGQKVDPNQELVGQGLSNISAAITSGYPVSGSFARTAVNYQSGAQTGLASLFTSLTVLITLLFLTPLFYYLPQSVLAATIIISVVGLIKLDKIYKIWKVNRSDGVIVVITLLSTIFFAPDLDKGILIGVIMSTGYYIYTRARPRITRLSSDKSGVLHDTELYNLVPCKHMVILRFDGSLFFANSAYLESKIISIIKTHPRLVTHVLLISNGINYVDYTGIETLENIAITLHDMKKKLVLTNMKSYILEEIRHAGILDHNEILMFKKEYEAVKALYAEAHISGEEPTCPLTPYIKRI